MNIAAFGIIQASLKLFSLIAIIQNLACINSKNYGSFICIRFVF